jgi:WD40 repeat protein/predicted Ser/Thr protein kinase
MPDTRTCPECNAPLPLDAPDGACPHCTLRAALGFADAEHPTGSAETVVIAKPLGEDDGALPRFGDYELLEEIARGGMGVVYRARQVSLDRIVAVKMLLFGPLASKEFVQRFRVEASAAASLQHPNIVAVHEVGVHQNQHYLVMDYIAGQTLSKLSGGQPLPPRAAATYVKTIAEAIHFAHERGVLHRDLKPSNVLIDLNDEPHVTDFGLAKRLDADSDLTLSGQVLGSPNYMSPEQATGKRGKVGRYSDVYSLGAILFHLLTGRPPFVAETASETIQLVLEREPFTPRSLVAGLPRDLETICLKCLQKEPAKRYATAQGLAHDLGHFLNDEPIQARPVSAPEKVWRWCRRKPMVATLSAATVVLLLAVSIGSPIAGFRIRQRSEALRRHLYVADMGKAYQAAKEGEVARARQLIDRHRPKPGEEDLRGFEWRYLWALCSPNDQSAFPANDRPFGPAIYSPDGKMMAGWDASVAVYEVATRRLLHRFERFDDVPEVSRRVAFSRDGRFLAAKGKTEIHVWRTTDWSAVFYSTEAKLNENAGNDLVISPDGTTVAAPTEGGVGFWNLQTRQKIPAPDGSWPTLRGDWFLGMRMAYSTDGKFLAVSHYTTNQIRDARTLDIITNLVHAGHETTAFRTLSLAFSTNYLAAGYREGELRLWDTRTWNEVIRIKPHATFLTGLDFSPDGRYLATGGQQEHVSYLWHVAELVGRQSDSATPKPLATLKGHTNSIGSIHFSPDGQTLAATSRDRITKLWSVPSETEASVTLDHSTQVLWISPDGQHLISFNDDNRVYAWETSATLRSRLLNLPTDIYQYGPRAVSPEGRTLAFGQKDETTEVWNLETGKRSHVIRPLGPQPTGGNSYGQLEFSPDGKLLLCFQPSAGLVLKDLVAAGKDMVLTNLASPFALSADGRVLAAAWRAGDRIELWRMDENRSGGTLDIPMGVHWAETAGALCFSPDGQLLVAASVRTDSIQVWNVKSKWRERVLPLQKPFVESMVFSPDGKTLVVRSVENVVVFWNVATWEEMFREFHYCPGGGAVRFSADGSALTFPERLSLDGQRPYVLWRAPSFAEIAVAEQTKADGTLNRPDGGSK